MVTSTNPVLRALLLDSSPFHNPRSTVKCNICMLWGELFGIAACYVAAKKRRQFRNESNKERVVMPKSYRHLTCKVRCQIEALM